MSTAAGIIVTRAASEGHLGTDLTGQLAQDPRVPAIGAGILAFLGLVPGLPTLPFLALAGVFAYVARLTARTPADDPAPDTGPAARPVVDDPEALAELIRVDPLE